MSIRTINLGLRPTPTQSVTLEVLQAAFAAACNHISAVAWQEQEFHRVGLQHLVYQDVRALYGLKAQHTIRAIAVVADSYKVDESKQHRFSSAGAVPFDTPRLYQLRGTQVRLSTCGAPVTVEVRLSKHQAQILASGPTLAEADLVQDRKGRWRFLISARFPDAPQHSCAQTLGVDLGRRDIAHTSWVHDITTYSTSYVLPSRDGAVPPATGRDHRGSAPWLPPPRRVVLVASSPLKDRSPTAPRYDHASARCLQP